MLQTSLIEQVPKKRVPSLPTQDDLPYDDGVPMETERHRLQMELLINSLKPWLKQHGGGYVSGNMFVYFSTKQVRHQDFKGPDVFVVQGVSNEARKSWVVWEEGASPNVIIELLSESTAKYDKGKKKEIYQNQLKAKEYYWFDPFNPEDWAGFELKKSGYEQNLPDAQNRLVSQTLGLALTRWHGIYEDTEAAWLRWETLQGTLLPTPQEARDAEKQRANTEEQRANAEEQRANSAEQRADAEAQRAEAAEAEIARLKALLAEKG
jgi:Uma2 family endonuclease